MTERARIMGSVLFLIAGAAIASEAQVGKKPQRTPASGKYTDNVNIMHILGSIDPRLVDPYCFSKLVLNWRRFWSFGIFERP